MKVPVESTWNLRQNTSSSSTFFTIKVLSNMRYIQLRLDVKFMRSNQYNTQPKHRPTFGQSHTPKQSLASILQKYERDLCDEVFLKLGNDLPVVEVIQNERQRKPMTAQANTVGRESSDQKMVWSKKYQGKENTVFEQYMQGSTGTGIVPVSHGNLPAHDRFRKKSPLNKPEPLQPSNAHQNNENLVFKAKQGKFGSLKDMLNELPANKQFRQSQNGPIRKPNTFTTPAMPPRFTTPSSAPVPRKLETPQNKPRLLECVRAPPQQDIEPSELMNDLGLGGLELSQDEMIKVTDQMKHLQETLIGILGQAKIHPTPEILNQIKHEVAAQVREFARNLLSDRVNSQKASKVGNDPDSSFMKNQDLSGNKNHSLFFSFESPINPKPDITAEDQFNLPTLLPDKAEEPVEQVLELENHPPITDNMVSNVAIITSKHMVTSGSYSEKPAETKIISSKASNAAALYPSIKLEGFDWLKPSQPVATNPQLSPGMGFHVDLGLNHSSDLDLSHTTNNDQR